MVSCASGLEFGTSTVPFGEEDEGGRKKREWTGVAVASLDCSGGPDEVPCILSDDVDDVGVGADWLALTFFSFRFFLKRSWSSAAFCPSDGWVRQTVY